jgi:hypothetical protein
MTYKIMEDSRGYSESHAENLLIEEAEELLDNLQSNYPSVNFWIEEQFINMREEAMFYKDKTINNYEK